MPLVTPYHGPTRKLADMLEVGDVIRESGPRTTVIGEPAVGPIPGFTTDDAVVVPIGQDWDGPHPRTTTTYAAYRLGQLVEVFDA